MSAYNAAKTLKYTLSALPSSSLDDWEAVIVNDASEDNTGDQLEEFSACERRVRVLHNTRNLGLAASLNRAIDAAQSPYLARLDADDIPLPDRLVRQCAFLDARSEVGVLGMGAYTIDEAGRKLGCKPPLPTVILPWAKLWRAPFIHPTVMLRREVLDAHGLRYNSSFRTAQDFELWSRLLRVTSGANLNHPGILYRVHDGQATKGKVDQRLDFHRETSRRQLADIVQTQISDSMMEAQRGYFLGEAPRVDDVPNLRNVLRWREMVAEKMFLRTGQISIKIGLGLDLWHLLRQHSRDGAHREILGTGIRRKNLIRSAPLLMRQRALTQLWTHRS